MFESSAADRYIDLGFSGPRRAWFPTDPQRIVRPSDPRNDSQQGTGSEPVRRTPVEFSGEQAVGVTVEMGPAFSGAQSAAGSIADARLNTPDDAGPGQRLGAVGNCDLLEEIARGGMGVVFRARQRALGRIVAVKVILDGDFSSIDQVRRFCTEAQAAANLKHPNIVAIHELGQHDGRPYLVMEFIEGEPLAVAVSGGLDERRAAELLLQIAEAVEHAHQHGVVHRDLKPSNVLVDRQGLPHLVDFGLAKLIHQDSSATADGAVIGTPSYMSPEQAVGDHARISPQSDVYGLGAILYELLTGRAPFRGETLGATLAMVENQLPVPPRIIRASLSRDLEAICLKCLEKKAEDRYSTAGELALELDRFLHGARIRARRRLGIIAKRGRPIVTAAFAGAVVGPTVGWVTGYVGGELAVSGLVAAAVFALVCIIAIHTWNELLLPACLLARSSHPLAKTAFGLGLVLFAVLGTATTGIWKALGYRDDDVAIIDSLNVLLEVACIIGKVLCLAASQGSLQFPLMWSVTADLAGFALSAELRPDEGEPHATAGLLLLVHLVSAILFVWAMKRMAVAFGDLGLERKARRLMYWMIIYSLVVAAIAPFLFHTSGMGQIVVVLLISLGFLLGILQLARLVGALQKHALERI